MNIKKLTWQISPFFLCVISIILCSNKTIYPMQDAVSHINSNDPCAIIPRLVFTQPWNCLQRTDVQGSFNNQMEKMGQQVQNSTAQDKKKEWFKALHVMVNLPLDVQKLILEKTFCNEYISSKTIATMIDMKIHKMYDHSTITSLNCKKKDFDKTGYIWSRTSHNIVEEKTFNEMSYEEKLLFITKRTAGTYDTKELLYFYKKFPNVSLLPADIEYVNTLQGTRYTIRTFCIKFSKPLWVQIRDRCKKYYIPTVLFVSIPLFFASLSRITEISAIKVINQYNVEENIINQKINDFIATLGGTFLEHKKDMLNEFEYTLYDCLKIYPAKTLFFFIAFIKFICAAFDDRIELCGLFVHIAIATTSYVFSFNIIPFENLPGGVLGCLSVSIIAPIIACIIYNLLYYNYKPEAKYIYSSAIDKYIKKEENGEIIIL